MDYSPELEEFKKNQASAGIFSPVQQVAQNNLPKMTQNMETPMQPAIQEPTVEAAQDIYRMPSMAPKQAISSQITAPVKTPQYVKAEEQYKTAEKNLLASQQNLLTQKAETEKQISEAEANTANLQSIESANRAREEVDIAKVQKADYDKRIAEIDSNLNKLKEYKFQDYFENKGAGTKILAAFSIMLGSIGSALTKGPNTALDIINKTIDDDSQRQVAQFNANKAIVGEMQAALNTARQLGMDQQDQRQYLNGLKTISIVDQLKSKLANIKAANPSATAELQANLDKLDADNKQKLLDLEGKSRASQTVTSQTVQPTLSDVTGPSSDLRKELLNRKEISDYQLRSSGYQSVISAKPGNPGDIALLYGYIKTLDPGSAVKEGEIDIQKAARSVGTQITARFAQLKNGGVLTPEERTKFKEQATKSINDYYKQSVVPTMNYYTKVAQSTGIDPRIIQESVPPSHVTAQETFKPAISANQAQIDQAKAWVKANPKDSRVPQMMQKIRKLQGVQNASK